MRRGVVAALALALVAVLVVAWRQARLPLQPVGCSAEVGGVTATLSPTQMGNAATIVGIAVRRGLPARAATIAIATALQESKLVNVRYGDRDSLGLFQQRPSQGWGTEAQVLDPVYATNAFYDRLVEVRDYRSLPITVAAQRVQRSGFPDAYAQHEQDARVVASALTGQSAAAVSCALDPDRPASGSQGPARLTEALRDEQPAPRSAPLQGRPGTRLTVRSAGPAAVWALSHWAVAASDRLGVSRVYADGRAWQRSDPDAGWAPAAGAGVPAQGSRDVLVLFSDTTPG